MKESNYKIPMVAEWGIKCWEELEALVMWETIITAHTRNNDLDIPVGGKGGEKLSDKTCWWIIVIEEKFQNSYKTLK